MGRVLKVTIVTKPEQIRKLDTGPYHILLGLNLRISNKKDIKVSKNKNEQNIKVIFLEHKKVDLYDQYKKITSAKFIPGSMWEYMESLYPIQLNSDVYGSQKLHLDLILRRQYEFESRRDHYSNP